MKQPTLMALGILLVLLLAGLWMTGHFSGTGREASGPAGEQRLMAGVDWETLESIMIESGSQRTHLQVVDGVWTVAEKDDHPADIGRLRGMVQALDELSSGMVADPRAANLEEYGLADDGEPAPTAVTLRHAGGTTVLRLGRARQPRRPEDVWMSPPGRYARLNEGPVVLLSRDISQALADPSLWWERVLLEIGPEVIQEIRVNSGGEAYALRRREDGTIDWKEDDPVAGVQATAASRLFSALRHLRAEQIMEADDIAGIIWEADADRFEAVTDTAVVTIEVAEALSDRAAGRPIRISVAAAEGVGPEARREVEAIQRRTEGRVYFLPVYLADTLRMAREDIAEAPESDSVPEPEPDGAPVPESESDDPEESAPATEEAEPAVEAAAEEAEAEGEPAEEGTN